MILDIVRCSLWVDQSVFMYGDKANSTPAASLGEAEKLLDILEKFSSSIYRNNSVDDILWSIASQCIAQLAFEDCVVYLLDEERNVLVQKAAYGPKNIDYRSIFEPIEIAVGQGVVGRVAATGKPLLIEELSEFEDYIIDDKERRSELAVPIFCNEQVIGVIDSEHSLPGFFQEIHLKTLLNIAHITGLKIGQSVANELSAEFRQFYLLNPNIVLQIDNLGWVVHSNPIARDTLGPCAYPGHKLRIAGLDKAVKRVKQTGKPIKFEFEVAVDNSTEKKFKITLTPLKDGQGYNAYGTEITELVEQRKRAVDASKAKSEFLSVMSHEIRTPLNAIIGLTDLLSQEGLKEEERKQQLKYLVFSSNHLLGLINDILDLEKIESGKAEPISSDFNLHTMLDRVVLSFRPKANEGGISLELALQSGVPEWVQADIKWITQILNNLISNALKYTTQGGVKVEVSNVTFDQVIALSKNSKKSEKSDSPWIRFKVTDTGRGIASKNINRVLNKFEQVNEPSNQRVGGTGLGLAITKNLVELQSGHLHVESEVGLGSVFTVDLPLQAWKQDQSTEEIPSKPAPLTLPSVTNTSCEEHHKKCPIIIADDNEIGQFVADRMIKRWGYSVLLASDGKEAVDLWKANCPCLILMDIHMPKMNGFKATQAIRKLEKSGARDGQVVVKSPILALTADAAELTAAQLKKVGMDGHIPKPFDPKHLHSQIEHHASELCRAFTSSGKTGE